MASNLNDEDSDVLDAVIGETLDIIAQEKGEWFLIFTNGTRLTLSSGYQPYFKVGFPHQ